MESKTYNTSTWSIGNSNVILRYRRISFSLHSLFSSAIQVVIFRTRNSHHLNYVVVEMQVHRVIECKAGSLSWKSRVSISYHRSKINVPNRTSIMFIYFYRSLEQRTERRAV